MYYLLDDPWPLGLSLAVLGLFFLLAVRITQRGKFLIWAGVLLGLSALVFLVEKLYVTDGERIEAVIYDLVDATRRSDPDATLQLLAPDIILEHGENTIKDNRAENIVTMLGAGLARGRLARQTIRQMIRKVKFDYIYVTQLETHANTLNRLGTAKVRIHAMGTFNGPYAQLNFATDTQGSDWSFGLREDENHPGHWLITRITAVRLPGNAKLPSVPIPPSG